MKLLGKIRVNYNYPIMIRDAMDEGSTALTIHARFLSSLIHQFFSLLGSSRVFNLFLEIFLREKKSRKMYMNCSFLSTNSWTSWTLFATSRLLSLDLFSFRLINNLSLFSSEHTTPILWPLKYVNGDGFKCNNKETEEKASWSTP